MMLDVSKSKSLVLGGRALSVPEIGAIANAELRVELNDDSALIAQIEESASLVDQAVDESWSVYGVTTGFGGMANVPVPRESAAASQNNLLFFLASGAGDPVSERHVRGAMALRANVLLQGKSGVRYEIIERMIRFLQADAIPVVRELGSIGASGDLVPLSAIARAITGQGNSVQVTMNGERVVDGRQALRELQLEPLELRPKEGLAIVNGTSFSSAIAANCAVEAKTLLSVALSAQAMMLQALQVQEDSLDEFVHEQKPHPGQVWTARVMRRLLTEGRRHRNGPSTNVQDRYSMRCFPQYMGPIIEGLSRVVDTIEVEMNSVSDNPLVDVERGRFCQSGNFLGQYVGIAMDDLRRFVGLTAKHLDVQIATLVSPEFSNGLPPSLRGNDAVPYNMGLKGLQITANSIAPMLTYFGNPLVEHFPTHAEQFNQNVNGLSWGAAQFAWKSVELFQHYLAVALIFAVQALDLRSKSCLGHYDGRELLGTLVAPFYDAVYQAMECEAGPNRPFLFDDSDLSLEDKLVLLREELRSSGALVDAMPSILDSFEDPRY